jgi:Tol biopolymer transport system component
MHRASPSFIVGPMRGAGRVRAAGASAFATGVAALLVVASVAVALRVPDVQYLSGYPAATPVEVGRPKGGFAPLAGRFIAKVFGLHPSVSDDGRTVGRRRDRSDGAVAVSTAREPVRVTVRHPFVNDSFARAFVVAGAPFSAESDTRTATREAGEPASCSGVGGTAWYRYTATRDEGLLATTFGSDYAVALGVFVGDRLGSLVALGCGRSATGNAEVGLRATRGATYYFQITGIAGGGDLVFNLDVLGRTERVSVSSTGVQGDGLSYLPSVSGDGRFVAFNSSARLTPDTPPCPLPQQAGASAVATVCPVQVFVHDRRTRATSLASASSTGEAANGSSGAPAISADGRYIAFMSLATNLGAGADPLADAAPDQFGTWQVYVRDRETGVTELVSRSIAGRPGGGGSASPAISADGRYVAFQSFAQNLTADAPVPCGGPPRPPCLQQVYVRDRLTGMTALVSRSVSGGRGDGSSTRAAISADGRTVAFRSFAPDLVPGDTNGHGDMFARDVVAGTTELISVSSSGERGNADSGGVESGSGYLSADGSRVAFASDATNLVDGDTNAATDFFVRDRRRGTTTRVSVSSAGSQGVRNPLPTPRTTSDGVAISGDGRYVAFDTALLFDDDDPAPLQIYVRDLVRGVTLRVSVSSLGEPGNDHSMDPALGASGAVVAFSSSAGNLVRNDTNTGCVAPTNTTDNCSDIFVHDLAAYL